jgi:hypothetical protein
MEVQCSVIHFALLYLCQSSLTIMIISICNVDHVEMGSTKQQPRYINQCHTDIGKIHEKNIYLLNS